MARDLTWGLVQANDGHRAYIPEAGQRDYHIPAVWADRLEDKVELRVKATVGEWANVQMMPSYRTLGTYQPLTSKFRTVYVGVVHDVMLRRLKKAAYKYAQEIERQVDELSTKEEEEEPPLPSAPRSTSKSIGKMSEQPTASSPEADVFCQYKKIKTLVTEKRSEESSEDYIKDVWPMITNATESDEAKKLCLSHVTAHPQEKNRKEDFTDHQHRKAHKRKAPFSLGRSTTNCPLKKRRPSSSPADSGPGGQPSNDDAAVSHPGKCLLEGGRYLHKGGRRTLSSGHRGCGIHDSQRPKDNGIPYGPICQRDHKRDAVWNLARNYLGEGSIQPHHRHRLERTQQTMGRAPVSISKAEPATVKVSKSRIDSEWNRGSRVIQSSRCARNNRTEAERKRLLPGWEREVTEDHHLS
ncbi:hypothetical protein XENOCAPTIV_024559 [Xenoophorus captivus]|uniref:Uncharacterized protein n=1 Tax=Xenoophorus captivus TaxID=1517983 RepID=A0ABV0RU38_9TELE